MKHPYNIWSWKCFLVEKIIDNFSYLVTNRSCSSSQNKSLIRTSIGPMRLNVQRFLILIKFPLPKISRLINTKSKNKLLCNFCFLPLKGFLPWNLFHFVKSITIQKNSENIYHTVQIALLCANLSQLLLKTSNVSFIALKCQKYCFKM